MNTNFNATNIIKKSSICTIYTISRPFQHPFIQSSNLKSSNLQIFKSSNLQSRQAWRLYLLITFEPIERHKYSDLTVRLSTLLYTRVNCGLRSVVEILSEINDTFDGLLGTIPCYNTIENWVKKCGLQVYETAAVPFQNVDYTVVVDKSMMIGSEKLLLTLGVPAEHQGRPLNFADVCVLDIAIADSWNGEGVAAQLRKASKKVGNNPQYVISDNASIMNKGVRCAQMNHQPDIYFI